MECNGFKGLGKPNLKPKDFACAFCAVPQEIERRKGGGRIGSALYYFDPERHVVAMLRVPVRPGPVEDGLDPETSAKAR